jgi:CRP/FNR family cyclic AMP-dependent transcriptional regulator
MCGICHILTVYLVNDSKLWHTDNMLATTAQQQAMVDLFHGGTKLTYKRSEFIIRPGEPPSGVFYIDEGLVKAYDITKYGEENLLIIRRDCEIFPMIWAVTGQERDILYQALVPTTVWRLSRKRYIEALQADPSMLAPLLDMTMEMYRIHSERIINLEYRSVRERLVAFLLIMNNRFGIETSDGNMIDVPLRQQDIASSINASRETTSRELSLLEKKGLVTTSPRFILLHDLDRLKAFL